MEKSLVVPFGWLDVRTDQVIAGEIVRITTRNCAYHDKELCVEAMSYDAFASYMES